ncbi:mitotic spindle assembly checkpoint protein MAD2 [Cryptococcus deuterogattii R265]|uniref:Mitotic spindle assembly checkpoint protein MAD2 n=1 Tax=Cryptococcus deuterogattii (strain R265) TaxID=294750 RepID=A0A095EMB0_CRYD2|nr:mitotic spindle assembly checkpoint protein MAD2 [Cryptococcus deuterogattii R265]KIR27994.1 mitotic spindle assembly checkpoint protein MAD2 [Cryptococcus deuterogattii LA55]KIR32660.1 mitotic spindle assembly checkpoint protein MAD2 [Cryptococcus deuterogattii MMRL2647]KIR70620.1 mitotic spindle assembly checkpoint protein MAD2 [Cryptococcus deuterogattii CA1014]KIR90800.1 mitotic spindle assembly checkpoint protein MAD2 [Cryptococcus deuterogattii CBS 10090]KIR97459.1 mitotic spindle ass
MAQKQATRTNQAITLKGSTALVTEFFEYSVNSILYQRGVYPSDDFRMVKKYGLPMLVTADEELKEYISTVLSQVQEWLLSSSLSRIVLAIKSVETGETLERWQFDIYTDESTFASLPGGPPKSAGSKKKEKTEKEVQGEIREIMKQITSSVTFLPILEEECTFTILAHTNDSPDVAIPATWDDADPHLIDKGKVEQVRLRSFSTNVHSLEAMVAYRVGE